MLIKSKQLQEKDFLEFKEVKLFFEETNNKDIFSKKNNKTLRETIDSKRYIKFKKEILNKYHQFLDLELGKFLLKLKIENNNYYSIFLNKYGDLEYSKFKIMGSEGKKKGLYLYTLNSKIVYIGRCLDSYKKRINQGYGKIHPKNCFIDGQSTNCHLNSLITRNKSAVELYLYPLEEIEEIKKREVDLIKKYNPKWNIQLKK